MIDLDLDAARRETTDPDGIRVIRGGEEFILPAELPVDVLDPFLNKEFDLPGMLRDFLSAPDDEEWTDTLASLLVARPNLPLDTKDAILKAFELLIGVDEWQRWVHTRPSVQDYVRLTRGLLALYGSSLGEAFASASSSESDGSTPKQTSPASTSSTPAPSGGAEAPETDSSESAD